MRSVRACEARNGLSALVERASKGEEIIITRRGQNVALLVPVSQRSRRAPRNVVEHIRQPRRNARIPKGYTLRQLVEHGRRY